MVDVKVVRLEFSVGCCGQILCLGELKFLTILFVFWYFLLGLILSIIDDGLSSTHRHHWGLPFCVHLVHLRIERCHSQSGTNAWRVDVARWFCTCSSVEKDVNYHLVVFSTFGEKESSVGVDVVKSFLTYCTALFYSSIEVSWKDDLVFLWSRG